MLGLLLSEMLLIYGCYIVATFFLFEFVNDEFDPQSFLLGENGLLRIALIVVCIMLGIYFHDLYARFRVRSKILLLQQLCLVFGIAFLTQAFLTYLKLPNWTVPKWLMIFGSALTLLVLPLWRMLYSEYVVKILGNQRVIFLGTSSIVKEIATHLEEHPEVGFTGIGYVDDLETEVELPGGKLLGKIKDLTALVTSLKPNRIVVGMTERRRSLPVNELLELRFSGVHIEDALFTYEATFGRISIRELRPSQLIFSTELGPRPNSVLWHTVFSLAIAVILVVVFMPIMLLTAIAVKLSSPGPILHRQLRVGLNDRPFTVYKFRSMFADAEAKTGAVWAQKDDPRITPVGRWIRRLRFDELPQLFNVLKGDMSMVGPRPERPEFVKTLTEQIPYYRQRHCVKPGITGWAQINYKYGDTLQDTIMKLEYDLYYIKNLALTLDTFIMFHTLKVMLFSDSAQ
ncbi:MAG: TIGR03013 family PEP-CTERM/XrtA system glycosyltransferase [Acidobacteriaceae bacterium]|nr:TIGR03013 family PEP-CTERM/XrtA system glycosyltransferase [Acidobacteriaceae bacterium]